MSRFSVIRDCSLVLVGRSTSLSAGKCHRQSSDHQRRLVRDGSSFQPEILVIPNRAQSPVRTLLLPCEHRRFGQEQAATPPTLPWSLFQQSLLKLLLALDAMPRPRHGLQSLGIDFLAAMNALAKAALANTRQRLLHHLQQLPLIVALAEQKLFGVGTGSAVSNILRRILVSGAAVRLGSGNRPAQILLPRLQPLLE